MSLSILLSGATGFLGSSIAEELVSTTDATVYALVRPKADRTPSMRLEALWCERPALRKALGTRIVPIEGDIERELLGLTPEGYDELARTTDAVIHAAAEVGIHQTYQRLWDVNVHGTARMLDFAARARHLLVHVGV